MMTGNNSQNSAKKQERSYLRVISMYLMLTGYMEIGIHTRCLTCSLVDEASILCLPWIIKYTKKTTSPLLSISFLVPRTK
jgi:hypothetical protein